MNCKRKSKTALYPFTLPAGRCIGVRSLREVLASEGDMVGAESVPFGANMAAEACAALGLNVFAGEDSV